MGWTCANKPTWETTKEYLIRQINCDNDTGRWTVLDCAQKLRTIYMAVEFVRKNDGTRRVFAMVILTEVHRDRDYGFCWKEISEDMGPFACDCPVRILNLLTEPTNEAAAKWRHKCREAATATKVGAMFRSEDGIRFSDGKVRHNFTFEGRGILRAEDGARVRMPRVVLTNLERVTA